MSDCPATVKFISDVSDGKTCPETITRTYRVTNSCGNFNECTQTITVNDTTKPVLAGCPSDASVECASQIPAAPTVTASDNCDGDLGAITPTVDDTGAGTCPRTITRTWTAKDACGNTASCKQTITVQDKTAPVITLSGGKACGGTETQACGVTPVFPTATANDNCDGALTPSASDSSTPGPGTGTTFTRTWTVKDACGNPASCKFSVIIPSCNLGCTFTQGYYKNHESLTCKLIGAGILVGCQTYSCKEVLAIYGTPVKGNGAIALFHQLVTAKLNSLNGGSVPSGVKDCINAADALLCTTGRLPSPGSLSTSATSSLTNCLDNYNNGLSGVPHCE
jgi:hypothetical protein